MLTRDHQRLKDFDALAFEEERFEVFQRTETNQIPSDAYYNGDWDARLAIEPSEVDWLNESYRQGYLADFSRDLLFKRSIV